MKNLIFIVATLFILNPSLSSQVLNNISIEPQNPSVNDSVYVISDMTYNGNCEYGMVGHTINFEDTSINIYPFYCGYFDSTVCNSIDTINLGVLPEGQHNIYIEFHQGSVCPVSGFDAIIMVHTTSVDVNSVSSISNRNSGIKVFNIYPNPVEDRIQLSNLNFELDDIRTITIFDMIGNKYSIIINDSHIEIQHLSSGTYILSLELNNGELVKQKFIKN